MAVCRECRPGKGGYNHVDCMNGKKSRKTGKIVVCTCAVCQVPGIKYHRRRKHAK